MMAHPQNIPLAKYKELYEALCLTQFPELWKALCDLPEASSIILDAFCVAQNIAASEAIPARLFFCRHLTVAPMIP